jgi:hypothetical protein
MTSKAHAGTLILLTLLLAPLSLLSCSDSGSGRLTEPREPADSVPRRPLPFAITMVSGNGQEGMAGVSLRDYLVVRLSDADGQPVAGANVVWKVETGAGRIWSAFDGEVVLCGSIDGCTDARGHSQVEFVPTTVGTTTVTAEVAGLQGSPVTFTADAAGTVIFFAQGWMSDLGQLSFISPDWTAHATVAVGTPVEWIVSGFIHGDSNWDGSAHIVSTTVPPGGEAFDSGPLSPCTRMPWYDCDEGRFQFVPATAGTWEFVDRLSGARGTLTAR